MPYTFYWGHCLNRIEDRVLSAVTAAVRQRRARETSRLLWRIAPAIAAVVLLLSVVARWVGASPLLPLAVLGVACLAWAAVAFVRQRVERISDQTAAAIDSETRLNGELRSAAWFASHSTSDPWAEFHLQHAAARLESIDFAEHYPPIRAPRARIATGVMIAATVVLAVAFPQRPRAVSSTPDSAPAAAARKVPTIAVEGLPPELPQDLEDLLTAIENEKLTSLRPGDAALLDALSKLQSIKDPQALAALARALASDRAPLVDDKAAMKDLADRAKRDATMTPSSDLRDALDQLAKNLSESGSEKDSASFEKSDEAEPNGAVDLAGATESVRDASAIAGIGMVAMSKQDSAQSDAPPGVGAGGTSGSPNGGGTMPDIAKALRHEVIEANEDDVTGDVHSEERRKTERGTAATTYARGAVGHSDGSRAAAPPPVPETRRAGVQTYFTRKP
jgi:hypothetical protein